MVVAIVLYSRSEPAHFGDRLPLLSMQRVNRWYRKLLMTCWLEDEEGVKENQVRVGDAQLAPYVLLG